MRLVLPIAFLLRLAWALHLPFGDGPDEARHTRTIAFFAEHGLPTREEIFSAKYGFYIASSPLPYTANIALEAIWPGEAPLFAQRMLMVLLGTLLVWLGYSIMLRTRAELALPLAWLLALQPQLCFQSAYVNWDMLTIVICTLIVATWPDLARRKINAWPIGALAGLCLLGKPTGFAVLPVLLALFLYARPSLRQFVSAAAGCALVSLPFLMHNNAVLPGDPFGFNTVLGTVSPDWEPSIPGGWSQLWTSRWLINTFESSWAIFARMAQKVPNFFYVSFALLTLLALVGCVRRFDGAHAVAVASVASSLMLAYATSAMNDFQPQGRYLFPSVVPMFGLFVSGLSAWGRWPLRITLALCVIVSGIIVVPF